MNDDDSSCVNMCVNMREKTQSKAFLDHEPNIHDHVRKSPSDQHSCMSRRATSRCVILMTLDS